MVKAAFGHRKSSKTGMFWGKNGVVCMAGSLFAVVLFALSTVSLDVLMASKLIDTAFRV